MNRALIHILLHVLVPLCIALVFYRDRWQKAWFLMTLGVLIDLDHVLAEPVYAPNRCSLGFHPLHGWISAACSLLLYIIPKSRTFGLGLIVHLLLDGIDCYWMIQELSG